jgi:hypothetical protein
MVMPSEDPAPDKSPPQKTVSQADHSTQHFYIGCTGDKYQTFYYNLAESAALLLMY